MISNLNRYIDQTLLKPETTSEQIEKLCEEAKKYDFFSVCVNPCHVERAVKVLRGTNTTVCTVIGFPLGANKTETKAEEARLALLDGARELDIVMNIGLAKEGKWEEVEKDLKAVIAVARDSIVPGGIITKVILETCLLTEDEIARAVIAAYNAGAIFVKTSTGFNKSGATVRDVAIMKKYAKNMLVKASGGIRTLEDAEKMIEAGADRLGVSAGVQIMEEYEEERCQK